MPQQNSVVAASVPVDGFAFDLLLTLSGNDKYSTSISVPAAKAGTLSTRTDANTGELTMGAGHGIVTGDRLDLYWAGGARRGMVVGVVNVNAVPIDLGSGDDLPAAAFAIVAAVPVEASFPLVNADTLVIAVRSDFECQFTFLEADDTTEDWTKHVAPAPNGTLTANFWASGGAFGATPLSGTVIDHVWLSHADTAAAHVMTAAYLST